MKVIILSGISGSGKSTYAEKIRQDHNGITQTCSADHYFEKDGKYNFDPSKLGEAHAACMFKFADLLHRAMMGEHRIDRDLDVIIVDNTNLSAVELAPYVALAAAYSAECELVTIHCDAQVAFERNAHGVPFQGIRRMANALRDRQLPPFWNIKLTTVEA